MMPQTGPSDDRRRIEPWCAITLGDGLKGMTTMTSSIVRFAAALLMAAGVSACAPGEIALEGKLFETLGVTNLGGGERETPKLAGRQPLVVPPTTGTLPEPGKAQNTHEPVLAMINDPDRVKSVDQAALQKAQNDYCEKYYEPAVLRGDQDVIFIKGPLGPCRKSALGLIGGSGQLFGGGADDEASANE